MMNLPLYISTARVTWGPCPNTISAPAVYHPVGEGIYIPAACTQVHFILAGYMLMVGSLLLHHEKKQ